MAFDDADKQSGVFSLKIIKYNIIKYKYTISYCIIYNINYK